MHLKDGTLDAEYFYLLEQLILEAGVRAAAIVKEIDQDLQTIRDLSRSLQAELVAERALSQRITLFDCAESRKRSQK